MKSFLKLLLQALLAALIQATAPTLALATVLNPKGFLLHLTMEQTETALIAMMCGIIGSAFLGSTIGVFVYFITKERRPELKLGFNHYFLLTTVGGTVGIALATTAFAIIKWWMLA